MFVFNKYNTVTGILVYEGAQQLVSGLVDYTVPDVTERDCRFTVVKREQFIQKSDETHRSRHDRLLVHFGWDQIQRIKDNNVDIVIGRTRLKFDGEEYRTIKINDFGQDYRRKYLPMGVIEVTFERRKPLAN